MGFLLNQNGIVLGKGNERTSRSGGSERTLWEEEKGNVKTCVDETSTSVCVFHSFHK